MVAAVCSCKNNELEVRSKKIQAALVICEEIPANTKTENNEGPLLWPFYVIFPFKMYKIRG